MNSHVIIDSIKIGDGKLDDKLLRPSCDQYSHRELETYMAEQLEIVTPWIVIC